MFSFLYRFFIISGSETMLSTARPRDCLIGYKRLLAVSKGLEKL